MSRLIMRAVINCYAQRGLVWLTSTDPNVAELYNPYISVFLRAEEARRLAAELLEAAELASPGW